MTVATRHFFISLVFLIAWCSSECALVRADEFSPQQLELFEKQIRPLLVEHCLKCHGPEKQEGGLSLATRESLLKGGDSGAALVVGKPMESLLIEAVEYLSEPQMPPSGKLPAEKIEILRRWVESGAVWPKDSPLSEGSTTARGFQITEQQKQWWAFQPRSDVRPPDVRAAEWPRNDLDRFVLARLEATGLAPAPAADRVAWLRRATFDLTGLPPTPEEVAAFLSDASDRAFETVVERLLDSPAYGQRWARHWLDVVRYADYHDFNPGARVASCEITEAWRYRDWVVDALNRNMPFDQFIVHQIAGDQLPNPTGEEIYPEGLIATTFLSNGVWDRGDADKEKIVSDMVDDNIGVIGKAFLGLTLDCARCHDHKFDPISTEDYYGLAGMFYSSHILKELGTKGGEYNVNRVPLIGPTALAKRADQEQRLAKVAATLEELDQQHRFQQLTAGGRPLTPTAFQSEAGAMGMIADDGSITVSGKFARDTYVVEMIVPEGITGGNRVTALTEFLDVYPTLCDLAGLPMPAHVEGKSLVPLMRGEDVSLHDGALTQMSHGRGQNGMMGWAIRTPRYRYIEWRAADFSADRPVFGKHPQAIELYDYESDPLERENLAEKTDHAAVLKTQQALFDRLLPHLPALRLRR